MEKIKIVLNKKGNTLDVWFGNPQEEFLSEGTGEEIILKNDKAGRVIEFEKLNFLAPNELKKPLFSYPVEVLLE